MRSGSTPVEGRPPETLPPSPMTDVALKACDGLLAEARAGKTPAAEWSVEELEALRAALATTLSGNANRLPKPS